MTSFENP